MLQRVPRSGRSDRDPDAMRNQGEHMRGALHELLHVRNAGQIRSQRAMEVFTQIAVGSASGNKKRKVGVGKPNIPACEFITQANP